MSQLTIKTKVHFHRGKRSQKELCLGEEHKSLPPGRIPRLSRLMALAIKIEKLVRDDILSDYAMAAQLGYVTRARMTQITNLLNLAPDIQEDILFLPLTEQGRDAITERDLRAIVTVPDWGKQRKLWNGLCGH